jgi:hypothetical protein
MRMSMRRLTRLSNAFSKKLKNHLATVAVYFKYYNFGRIHQTLRVTPGMEARVADHVWSYDKIIGSMLIYAEANIWAAWLLQEEKFKLARHLIFLLT